MSRIAEQAGETGKVEKADAALTPWKDKDPQPRPRKRFGAEVLKADESRDSDAVLASSREKGEIMVIYNGNAEEITAGVQEHEVHDMAQSLANDRGEPVWYGTGDLDETWDGLTRVDPQVNQ